VHRNVKIGKTDFQWFLRSESLHKGLTIVLKNMIHEFMQLLVLLIFLTWLISPVEINTFHYWMRTR